MYEYEGQWEHQLDRLLPWQRDDDSQGKRPLNMDDPRVVNLPESTVTDEDKATFVLETIFKHMLFPKFKL